MSSEYCLLLFDAHAPKTPETSTNRKVPYSHACRCMPDRGTGPRTLISTRSNRSSIRKRGAAHKVIVSQLRPHMGSPYEYLGSTAHGFCPNVTFRTYEYDAFE